MKNSTSKIPEISVITCHHKGSFIYKFVESVKSQTWQDFEIIVITSDPELAEKGIPDCLVVYHEGMPAAKRNCGARLARGRNFAFFDDDVELDRFCLAKFFIMMRVHHGKSIEWGKLYNMEHRNRFDEAGGYITSTGFIWSRAGQNDVDEGQYDKDEEILAGKSAAMMIDRRSFEDIKGFDEDFGILGEETDLAWRAWLQGTPSWFNFEAVAYHAFNTKYKPANEYYTSKRVHYNGCKNYLTMLLKNLGTEHLWIVPIHAMIWLTSAFGMLITGKLRQAFNIILGCITFLRQLPKTLSKRSKIQSCRLSIESDLWPKIHRKAPRGYYTQRFCRYIRIGLHG